MRQIFAAVFLVLFVSSNVALATVVNSAYTVTLDGDQQVPPSGSGNTGQGTLALDKATGLLSYTITHNLGDAALAAHIHGPAKVGQNSGVLYAFPSAQSPMTGSWKINDRIADDLLLDKLYVNIHTEENPDGEIRGQILLATIEGIAIGEAKLEGSQQVPPVDSKFSGRVDIEFSNFTGILKYNIRHTVTNPTMIHFHTGAAGTNGGVAVAVGTAEENNVKSPIVGEVEIDAATQADLLAGNIYLNIHTAENPDGEIRGQIEITGFKTGLEDEESSKDDGLSGGAIFGIVFTVLLVTAALIVGGVYYMKRRNNSFSSSARSGGYVRDTALLDDAQQVESGFAQKP